eukprot:988402-Amphidinium_carterae.1
MALALNNGVRIMTRRGRARLLTATSDTRDKEGHSPANQRDDTWILVAAFSHCAVQDYPATTPSFSTASHALCQVCRIIGENISSKLHS